MFHNDKKMSIHQEHLTIMHVLMHAPSSRAMKYKWTHLKEGNDNSTITARVLILFT